MSLALRKNVSVPIGILLLLAVVCAAYGLYTTWQWWYATHNPNPAMPTEVVSISTDTPDETAPIETCDALGSTGQQPQSIRIASIGVDGCVQRVGIDQYGAIAVPTNIYFAGWYVKSPMPGDAGVSIIDGHVLGRYNDAIFASLAQVATGDIIEVSLADNTTVQFETVDSRVFTKEEANQHLYEKLPNVERQLTLITCIGTYDRAANTYDKRVIVRAALKEHDAVD